MLLKELYANVQQQRDQLDRQRHHQAAQLTLQARQLIEQATAEAFRNKALLSEALELLMTAIQNHRQHLEAYLCLAYLCFLIGDDQSALAYLKDAELIQAQHPIVQSLKAEILRLRFVHLNQASQTEAGFESEGSDPEEALDEDELRRLILDSIRNISGQHPPGLDVAQVLETEAYQTARQFQERLQARHGFFEQQINRLERDFDVMALRQALRPLEIFLRRYQQQLDQAQLLLSLQRQIQRELKVVRQIYERLLSPAVNPDVSPDVTPDIIPGVIPGLLHSVGSEGFKSLEHKLEQSLDQVDWFADQLDALDKAGALPARLLQDYEALVALSQEVMDALDEPFSR